MAGPSFAVAWHLAGPTAEGIRVVQHLHPQAHGGPLVHTEPGQAGYDGETGGGWYRASSRLMDTLGSLGWATKHTYVEGAPAVIVDALPASEGVEARATAPTGTRGAGQETRSPGRRTAAAVAVVVAATAAAGRGLVHRRRRVAAAAG